MEDRDQDDILELQRLTLGESAGHRRTSDLWNWKHTSNPFGSSLTFVAVDTDETIIGLRAFMRWEFRYGRRLVTAARAVDTATHPDYQRMGIFSRITLAGVTQLRDEETDLIFNTPNDKSHPGYIKLGWNSVGAIRPMVRVLNRRRFAMGLARHFLRPATEEYGLPTEARYFRQTPPFARTLFDRPDLEDLIEHDSTLRGPGLVTPLSNRYLRWRYDEHPTVPYWCVTLERTGVLEAAALIRLGSRFGLREVVMSDLFLSRPDADLVRNLTQELVAHLDADYLVTYFPALSVHRRLLRRSGFRPAPLSALKLVTNPLSGWATRAGLTHPDRWGLSIGDLEFF